MPFPEATLTALLGQAVGDSFGAAFEYDKQAARWARVSLDEGRYLDAQADVGRSSRHARLPGLYTDDTQQALALLHAWRAVPEPLDAAAVGARFREICLAMGSAWVPGSFAGLHRGTGKNFREFLERGGPVDTAGMGAAMRIGPVATLLPDLETLLPWVVIVSRQTTTHPVALSCAAIYAAFCHDAARGGDGAALAERLGQWLDRPAADALGLPREAWLDPFRALSVLQAAGESQLLEFAAASGYSDKPLDCAANGFALTGVPWALHHAQAPTISAAFEGACRSGGDTDTVCAMVGCLAALRLGRGAIPAWMVEDLVGRQGVLHPDQWDPVRTERLLTQKEEDHRRLSRVRWPKALDVQPFEGPEEPSQDDPLAALEEIAPEEATPLAAVEPEPAAEPEPPPAPEPPAPEAPSKRKKKPAETGPQLNLFDRKG